MNVRELVVKLVMDASGFRKDAQDAQRDITAVDRAEKGVERQSKETGKALEQAAEEGRGAWEGLKGAIVGVLSVATAVSAGQQFLEQTKQVETFADELGMSVEEWQAWAGAAGEAGIAAEDFGDKMRDVADWVTDLNQNESGPLKDFAEKAKISFKDAAGASVTAEEGFLRIAEAVEGMDRKQAIGWLTQIGFNQDSLQLLLKGRKAVEALVQANKAKAVYDKQDIENAAKMRAAWDGISRTFQRVAAMAISAIAPAFDWIREKADKAFSFVKANGGTVERVLAGLAAVVGASLVPKLFAMGKAAWASLGPFSLVAAAIAAIGLAIDDFIVWLEGGESKLAEFWGMFGTAEEVSARLTAIWEGLKATWASLREIVSSTLDLFGGFFTGNWDMVVGALERLKNAFSNLGNVISGVLDWIKGKLMGLLPDWIQRFLSGESTAPAQAPGPDGQTPAPVDSSEDMYDTAWAAGKNAAQSGQSVTWKAPEYPQPPAYPQPPKYPSPPGYPTPPAYPRPPAYPQPPAYPAPPPAPGTGTMKEALGQSTFAAPEVTRTEENNISNTTNKTLNSTITNNITVQTQATDSAGIAKDLGPTLQRDQTAMADVAFGA